MRNFVSLPYGNCLLQIARPRGYAPLSIKRAARRRKVCPLFRQIRQSPRACARVGSGRDARRRRPIGIPVQASEPSPARDVVTALFGFTSREVKYVAKRQHSALIAISAHSLLSDRQRLSTRPA
jgi:hypothetical protein